MCTMPRSDNPILKIKPTVFIQECFYLFKKKNIHYRVCAVHRAKRAQVNNFKCMCCFSRDIVLCRSKVSPYTQSQLLSPSVWTPVLSPPQVFWADWSTWALPCLFKNSRAQTPNYEYAEQQGREAHLFHGLAACQTFFFLPLQQQEDRSLGWTDAEVQEATAERATVIETFRQSTPKKKRKKKAFTVCRSDLYSFNFLNKSYKLILSRIIIHLVILINNLSKMKWRQIASSSRKVLNSCVMSPTLTVHRITVWT